MKDEAQITPLVKKLFSNLQLSRTHPLYTTDDINIYATLVLLLDDDVV